DCPGRARRLAGGDHIAVADAAILLLRLDARGVDALHTIGAFFHHAACAHRDVRVAQPLQAGGLIISVLEKIKTPDLVGAVVRAVARADTAIVDHIVQAFAAVHRGPHRTYHFARRVFAVHA